MVVYSPFNQSVFEFAAAVAANIHASTIEEVNNFVEDKMRSD